MPDIDKTRYRIWLAHKFVKGAKAYQTAANQKALLPYKKEMLRLLTTAQVSLVKVIKNIGTADQQKDYSLNFPMLKETIKQMADSLKILDRVVKGFQG
jgi:hypothetical protein